MASGDFRLKGTVQSWNSVLGTTANRGYTMVHACDPVHDQLIVGQPAGNLVSLFSMDQIFADDFEQ